MQFQISVECQFSAAHQLVLYDGSLEPLHRHVWRVRITVGAERLDRVGLVMDFRRLERLLDAVLADCKDRRLNDLEAFADRNPSAENIACHIGRSLRLPHSVSLECVEVWETPTDRAVYRP